MKNIIIFSILVFSVLSISCRSSKEEKIIGVWKEVLFTDPELATATENWQFYAGDALIVETTQKSDGSVDTVQYTYNIDGSTLKIFGDWGYAPGAGDIRGQYWVDELDKKYLKMTKRKHPDGSTDGVFLRIELVKQ